MDCRPRDLAQQASQVAIPFVGAVVVNLDRIALLLTDVIMPGMNGWEPAERASQLQPRLKVLFRRVPPA